MSSIDHSHQSVRNKQLGLKVREELYWEIKKLALQKKCRIVEIIEESVVLLSQRERERERRKTHPLIK